MGEKNGLVVKSNDLIDGHYRLSAISQKIAASVISLVNPEDTDNPLPEFEFSLKDIAELLQVSERRVRDFVDSATLELKQLVITMQKPNCKSYKRVGLFSFCEYNHLSKKVIFRFEPVLEPYIRDFAGNFTQYQLIQIRELKSAYSIRLYEILRKVHPIKSSRPITQYQIDLDELKKMLGVDQNSYSGRFDRFKARILETSRRELTEKTDLIFDFEPIRRGRKIGAIKFIIRRNNKFKPVSDHEPEALTGQHVPKEADIALATMVRTQIPNIGDDELLTMELVYGQDIMMQSLIELTRAIATNTIKTTPIKYYKGILKNMLKEKVAPMLAAKTTEQKLTDRSWAEGLDLGAEHDD